MTCNSIQSPCGKVSTPKSPTTIISLETFQCESEEDENPVLKHLRDAARKRAEMEHATRMKKRVTDPSSYKRRSTKKLSKRQMSSKRSAEICRIKNTQYTALLEAAVMEEEKRKRELEQQLTQEHDDFQNLVRLANILGQLTARVSRTPTTVTDNPKMESHTTEDKSDATTSSDMQDACLPMGDFQNHDASMVDELFNSSILDDTLDAALPDDDDLLLPSAIGTHGILRTLHGS